MNIEEKTTDYQTEKELEENLTIEASTPTGEKSGKKEKKKQPDEPMLALNIFGFIFFLIGLIIYCAQKKKFPHQMESLKGWLIASFILRVAISVVSAFIR